MVSAIRFGLFIFTFLAMASLEYFSPRRKLSQPKQERWFSNISLTIIDAILVQITVGTIVFSAALFAKEHHWGLFNYVKVSEAFSIIISIFFLDFIIYIQHILFHIIPLFWRFHKVHHTDLDFDVSTGIRFHPLEIFLSLVIKMAAVVIIGAHPWAVVIFEIILNSSSLFNHSNVFIPLSLDRWLRYFIVTPDVHRVHHSIIMPEMNSNFGFSITWWDRLCGTYKAHPKNLHENMGIGLSEVRDPKRLNLWRLLGMPFV